jgi:hypothetical protein
MSDTTSPAGAPSKERSFFGKLWYAVRLIVVNFLIFAVLAEIASLIIVHRKSWPASRPTYRLNYNEFWADINPAFGTWHRPNGHYLHQEGCFSVEYTTNSYGARDRERSLHSSQPRTVVLGDSFVEGLGVPDDDRLTNTLERDTGREYLNFGTGGDFGPLQYALLYKTMAANFDHTAVAVGVLPDNDFHDMDLAYWKAHGWGNRYRPYYAPDFSIIYQGHYNPNAGKSTWDHIEAWLRAYLASYHVGQYIHSRFYWRTRGVYSGYNDFNDTDLARLKVALRDIQATADAHHAKMYVFLIPRANDFLRLHQTGSDRLGPVMEQWGREVGIPIKDLLPQMDAASGGNYMSYFLPCDGHWSARGGRTAAHILEPWLGETPPRVDSSGASTK